MAAIVTIEPATELAGFVTAVAGLAGVSAEFGFDRDGGYIAAVRKFLKKRLPHSRVKAVKAVMSALDAELGLGCKSFTVLCSLGRDAFMTDDGAVSLSFGLAAFGGAARTLKIVLHEAGHLWLLRQACYRELLALDRAFDKAYPDAELKAVSPTEYYASMITFGLLDATLAALGGHKKLAAERESEYNKIIQTARLLADI